MVTAAREQPGRDDDGGDGDGDDDGADGLAALVTAAREQPGCDDDGRGRPGGDDDREGGGVRGAVAGDGNALAAARGANSGVGGGRPARL
ncbi:MAG: hypothetical protein LBO05_09010, partial [Deltaproteobacteria bacterium]|nr:hypothetical protein [Deltaproteobacteria bacterium]